ncbi:MAG: hypothetical protein ACRDWW_02840 [Acidimicrobiales bacterium]
MGAYVIAAALDVISFIGNHTTWSHEYYQAAIFVLLAGLIVSLAAVVTGVVDWWTSNEPGHRPAAPSTLTRSSWWSAP